MKESTHNFVKGWKSLMVFSLHDFDELPIETPEERMNKITKRIKNAFEKAFGELDTEYKQLEKNNENKEIN